MKKKRFRAKWKKLTPQQEQKIVRDFNNGRIHNKIMVEYKIPAGQFYSIIKKTASK